MLAFRQRLVARLREKPMLTVEELKARADNKTGILLDVRKAADFVGEQGHIAGALNLPLEKLKARLDDDELLEGARRGTLDELAERTLSAERVLVF